MASLLGKALIVSVIAALAACGGPPPPPEPTIAEVSFVGGADQNPDPSGRPSPARVQVYALKPASPFDTGAAAALTSGDLGALAGAVESIGTLVLRPGETQVQTFEMPPGATQIGVAVGYRAIETAGWRARAPVPPNQTTALTARIGPNAVLLQ